MKLHNFSVVYFAEFYIFLFIAMSTEHFGQTFVSPTTTTLEKVMGKVAATTSMCLSTRFVTVAVEDVCVFLCEHVRLSVSVCVCMDASLNNNNNSINNTDICKVHNIS